MDTRDTIINNVLQAVQPLLDSQQLQAVQEDTSNQFVRSGSAPELLLCPKTEKRMLMQEQQEKRYLTWK